MSIILIAQITFDVTCSPLLYSAYVCVLLYSCASRHKMSYVLDKKSVLYSAYACVCLSKDVPGSTFGAGGIADCNAAGPGPLQFNAAASTR